MDHICRTDKYWLPWLVGMPTESCIAIVSLMMGNVLTLFPKLKFCFAHGGGSFPFTFGRIQHGIAFAFYLIDCHITSLRNIITSIRQIQGYDVRPDLCATECAIPPKDFLGRFYTDSLVHSHKSLDLLIDVIGEVRLDSFLRSCVSFLFLFFVLISKTLQDRIILGSDYPFPLGETTTGKLVESSDLDERIKVGMFFFIFIYFLCQQISRSCILSFPCSKEKILYKNGMEFIGLNN